LSIKYLENDKDVESIIEALPNRDKIIAARVEEQDRLDAFLHTNPESAIVDAKYAFIQGALAETYAIHKEDKPKATLTDKIDAVLKEIPIVQKDCGYIPLVTPTSQIVGTQSVFNVLFGRYKKLTAETRDLLIGRYGKTPAPCNEELVKIALAEAKLDKPVTARPADFIPNELDKIKAEAKENGAGNSIEDVLTYAMFPKVAPKFFKERSKGPVVFTAPEKKVVGAVGSVSSGSYTVTVNGTDYAVSSSNGTFTVNGTAYAVSVKENASSASTQKTAAAASASPLHSTRAFLHSIIPAPVTSRRAFTSAALISM